GRAPKGKRAVKWQKFVRARRATDTALLTLDSIVASKVVEGSMKRKEYLEFLEFQVLPLCSLFPGPLSILVMDNARIHHGEEVLELCDRFGMWCFSPFG
ncbi:hypothetical protein B0H17DRAFT_932109, partial [Mycena rosella]